MSEKYKSIAKQYYEVLDKIFKLPSPILIAVQVAASAAYLEALRKEKSKENK